MANNNFIKYIFGNWAKFIVTLITYIISLIGLTFLGGSFIYNSSPESIKKQTVPTVDTSSIETSSDGTETDLTGFSLYIRFILCTWNLMMENVVSITNSLFSTVTKFNSMITLFVLPVMASFCLPFLYPIMVVITIMSVFSGGFEGNLQYLAFPFTSKEYFCPSCDSDDDSWGAFFGRWLWHIPTFYISAFFLFLLNIMVWGGIAGGGVGYLLWYILIKPLSNYKDIFKILLNYSNILLLITAVIYFICCTIYLGYPLRVTSALIFVVSLLWLFFEYVKKVYLKQKV